jgi:hypothetical protein
LLILLNKLFLRITIFTMIYSKADFLAVFKSSKSQKWKEDMIAAMWGSKRRNRQLFRRKRRTRKPRNMHRNRGFAIEEMNNLKLNQPAVFKRMFRMDVASFDELVELLDPVLKKSERFSIISSGSAISTETRLAVTLRWLAGGSYIDLCFAWGLSKASFYSERGVLWPTIHALDDLLTLGLPLTDKSVLKELSKGFEEHSGGVMEGCILAIDGLAVRVRSPFESEVKFTKCWRCRKGGFAIIVMAGCDINGRFWTVTAKDSGSTHDSQAWNNSALADAISKGELDSDFFIIGDEAFGNTDQLLTPYPGRGLGEWKDSFNYWLSHSRQCIERAFGMLVQRWGIFWRKFIFSYDRWPTVITLCCKLHNFCLDRKVDVPTRRHHEDHVNGDSPVVLDNNETPDDALFRTRARGNRRSDITDRPEMEGRRRPPHAQVNSRK